MSFKLRNPITYIKERQQKNKEKKEQRRGKRRSKRKGETEKNDPEEKEIHGKERTKFNC